ncbi:hypothetical protein J2X31_002609 [Flavobacterium arsenatis]|uniref:Uncharacterized protein n=1 Tax=Flavobacterium arsenatis TaxID=1484332 RepID=A0ABU1TRV5_9FLAO|nr:hypothetical protein [Flavobacterium arsenatis]MDR6968586.1 hypothetical protein [Flavobacterium arsenatis]
MKTLKLALLGIGLMISSLTQAQVNVNVNVGAPPAWGPAGYDTVEYYYLPDVEAYYDVRASRFIYYGNGKWVRATRLPAQYRTYDLYSGYKVVLTDYHGPTPYIHHKHHKVKYHKGYKGGPQKTIGMKPAKKHKEGHPHKKGGKHHGKQGKGKDKK